MHGVYCADVDQFATLCCWSRLLILIWLRADGLAYMDGLMDNRSIGSNLRVLEKDYEDAYQSRGGLDERMFINGDDSLLGTSSGSSPRFSGSKVSADDFLIIFRRL